MIPSSPAGPVQQAVYARLAADAALAALGATVVDDTDEAQVPYVVIGAGTEAPDNAHGEFGRTVAAVVDIWSGQPGFAEANAILDRLVQLLDHQPLPLAGPHRTVAVRFETAVRLRDPTPPHERHIAAHFRVVTAQTE